MYPSSMVFRHDGVTFFTRQLALPFLLFVTFVLLNEIFHFDILVATALFHWQGGINIWPLRHGWITEDVLHTGGRHLVILLVVIVLTALVASYFSVRFRPYRRGLIYLLLSVMSTLLIVRFGKNVSHMDCPWDLTLFGGAKLYVPLFSAVPADGGLGQCFPAGHSSGGFAWVALYYVAVLFVPQKAKWGLFFGLCLGLVFGGAQQLRGAHFLSHDVWSAMIAWTMATFLFYLMFVKRNVAQTESTSDALDVTVMT